MTGIRLDAFVKVNRVQVTFQDELGNPPLVVSGTGFWVRSDGKSYFVTNKHNIDATLKRGPMTTYKAIELAVQLRKVLGPLNFSSETDFFRVGNFPSCVRVHPSADVAALESPTFINKSDDFDYLPFELEAIATAEFLQTSVKATDAASFVGYPGRSGAPWWDRDSQLPIARTINVASIPAFAFTHDDIKTSDAMLVSGLSFSGSSGSPVISHDHGMGFSFNGTPVHPYVPPHVIGIMSGHMWDEEPKESMFVHSGLSYLTRSTAIRELLLSLGSATSGEPPHGVVGTERQVATASRTATIDFSRPVKALDASLVRRIRSWILGHRGSD